MPLLADFVYETANNPGTGTLNLAGTVNGRRRWIDAFPSGTQVFYVITDGASWEEGVGTVTAGSPNVLSRDTVISNSLNGTGKINFTGSVEVYCEVPAPRRIFATADGSKVLLPAAPAAAEDSIAIASTAWVRDLFRGSNVSKASRGCVKLPGGILFQWGYDTTGAGGTVGATFLNAFPTALYAITLGPNFGTSAPYFVSWNNPTLSNFQLCAQNTSGTGVSGINSNWWAVGA